MNDTRVDLEWSDPARLVDTPRHVFVHDELRYAKGANQRDIEVDGFINYHWLTSPEDYGRPKVMLEAGINAPADVHGPDGARRPLIAVRSSPWKAGHETNPWHDEFDLDHGHVRYFGDHKPSTLGLPGATKGNRLLLEAARLHAGTTRQERLLAPPLLLFRSTTVHRDGRALVKGHVEFCGAAIIERLEHVVQRDPETGNSFPNIALDLAVVDGREIDGIDMRWIDDRRDPSLDAELAIRHAPDQWRRWVKDGRSAISGVRRRVLASAVKTPKEQQPLPGSVDAAVLSTLYNFYDGRKHAFELLASQVAGEVLRESGARYKEGWLSRSSGDGGVDFIGRIDMGSLAASTPVVVLGQAKCIQPSSTVSPEQVARVVARLRRGWIGVYVTTGSFSKQAQIEIIDDQYPVVLVAGGTLAATVRRMAQANYGGDLNALLQATIEQYADAIAYRRPEEVISM
ncbi:restriction endonuclease [Nocardioides sp. Soil796]|uniref:restriction endonuclease n=1 Tax=Nocardioides sp. Soil796 TaxID=1736412 RepID=UPI000709A3D0|nr:restriction endonuclease [Nocardioides sp. Soil796]KRF12820.1 restriction endonuclease [Nocardioides sp. Soil796]